jgi:hypothetical protein
MAARRINLATTETQISEPARTEFESVWLSLYSELQRANRQFLDRCNEAWNDLAACAERLGKEFESAPQLEWTAGSLDSLDTLFSAAASQFLHAPIAGYDRSRPQQKLLLAHDDYRSAVDDFVLRLPGRMEVPRAEVKATIGGASLSGGGKARLSVGRKLRTVTPRDSISAFLQGRIHRRARAEGELLVTIGRQAVALLDPWQSIREGALDLLQDGSRDLDYGGFRERWQGLNQTLKKCAEAALGRIKRNHDETERGLADALLKTAPPANDERRAARARQLIEYTEYWSRQAKAVRAHHELERDLAKAGIKAVAATKAAIESVESEHAGLLRELQAVEHWLAAWKPAHSESFPPANAEMAAAADRARDWANAMIAAAETALPVAIETVDPRRPLPSWRTPWRQIQARENFLKPLESTGRPLALRGLAGAESAHRALIREIERAREVVTYGLEGIQSGSSEDARIAEEAIANSRGLIERQRRRAPEVRKLVEPRLVEATASVLAECGAAIERGRLGFLARLLRERGRRSLKTAVPLAAAYLREGGRVAWDGTRRGYHGLLVWLEWEQSPAARMEHVHHRASLQIDPRSAQRASELPMIYQRLFRLEPLRDPRFLVGRQAEMSALEEIRRTWESGHTVSAIVVGERGSGKTSLLNCAEARVFAGADVVRASFCGRIASADEMDRFVRGLLRLEEGAPPSSAARCVVMLEELERSYLRRSDGFGGLTRLLGWINDTSRGVLWILGVNKTAFSYLNAATGLGRYFSHRINAAAVEPEALSEAILLRHNLSGMRLRFIRPPRQKVLIRRAKRLFGLDRPPREQFFAALYEQSEGIYRSAFEGWHANIDHADGGVLTMRFPVLPDLGKLIRELSRDDLFALQAIMQHGSLLVEEHAAIFGCPQQTSDMLFEGLVDRGLLEPEPMAPGWRVRSEAGYIVRKALYAVNLL